MRLWFGFFLLVGSLLLAIPIVLVGAYLVPLLLLLVVPVGGLLLATGLIVSSPQPLWAKLLALSPVLGPGLLLAAAVLFMPSGEPRFSSPDEAPAVPVGMVMVVSLVLLLALWLLRRTRRKRVEQATWQPGEVASNSFPSTLPNQPSDERIPLLARRYKQPPSP